MKLLGDGGASHLRTAFEDKRVQPSFGQVEGGHEAVVAGTDDDGARHRNPGYGRTSHVVRRAQVFRFLVRRATLDA
jgi:hypothetical protein